MAQNAFCEFISTSTAVRPVCSMPLRRSLNVYEITMLVTGLQQGMHKNNGFTFT